MNLGPSEYFDGIAQIGRSIPPREEVGMLDGHHSFPPTRPSQIPKQEFRASGAAMLLELRRTLQDAQVQGQPGT